MRESPMKITCLWLWKQSRKTEIWKKILFRFHFERLRISNGIRRVNDEWHWSCLCEMPIYTKVFRLNQIRMWCFTSIWKGLAVEKLAQNLFSRKLPLSSVGDGLDFLWIDESKCMPIHWQLVIRHDLPADSKANSLERKCMSLSVGAFPRR